MSKAQNSAHQRVDFVHIIEEIEDLGQACRRRVEGNLQIAVRHLIKMAVQPDEKTAIRRHKDEIVAALYTASDEYLPSMRQHIYLERVWGKARGRSLRDLDGSRHQVLELPEKNPFFLDQLLDENVDVDALLGILTDGSTAG